MQKWINPRIIKLGIENTNEEYCTWIDTSDAMGIAKEDYTDPNNPPADHTDWVWCTQHNRWHPNHGNPEKPKDS